MTTFKLEKPEEEVRRVGFVLQKQGIHERIPAQVGLTIDVSGSMQDLYQSGIVQAAIERVLPVALYFDDDGTIDAWVFSNGDRNGRIASATVKNYDGFVEREILRNSQLREVLWGGTDYGPVIRANLAYYGLLEQREASNFILRLFGGTEEALNETTRSGVPAINYFLTDGANSDRAEAWAILERARRAESQIYYVMVGIGDDDFEFLQQAADAFPNVGFVSARNLGAFVGSDDAYEKLLPEELCTWLKHEHDDEDEDHH